MFPGNNESLNEFDGSNLILFDCFLLNTVDIRVDFLETKNDQN